MDKKITPVSKIEGKVQVPGDKSISHRALILGAMTQGEVLISNLSTADDCAASIGCLRDLGIEIEKQSHAQFLVKGQGIYGFREPSLVLDAQNSGTTLRLLCGLLAGQPFYSVITGDGSLRKRPMRRVIEPLRRMGAKILGRDGDTKPPITIVGGELLPIEYTLPVASAQVKSAILIAGLFCQGETKVEEKIPTRDHTERMLRYLGADIKTSPDVIVVKGGKELRASDIFVPGDISSAIYFILAAILLKNSWVKIENVGQNPTRMGFIEALKKMGADIRIGNVKTKNEEPYADLEARSSELKAIEVSPEMIPSMIDEIPALALAATQAKGKTIIHGAGELRFKESDRLKTMATELKKLGAWVKEKEDGLEIIGPIKLAGATCHTYGDHRLVMTLAVAGLMAQGVTLIKDAEVVAVSFPGFFERLALLTGEKYE
ncbi:MAG: 3-phosphoshikimate 1-carboxyvinyltransferase [Candidatus Zixiibacteriota bacterium]